MTNEEYECQYTVLTKQIYFHRDRIDRKERDLDLDKALLNRLERERRDIWEARIKDLKIRS